MRLINTQCEFDWKYDDEARRAQTGGDWQQQWQRSDCEEEREMERRWWKVEKDKCDEVEKLRVGGNNVYTATCECVFMCVCLCELGGFACFLVGDSSLSLSAFNSHPLSPSAFLLRLPLSLLLYPPVFSH